MNAKHNKQQSHKRQFTNVSSPNRAEFDDYPTHPLYVEALLQALPMKMKGAIVEPCCGEGNIAKTLEARGYEVNAGDIQTRNGIYGYKGMDFLKTRETFANVVTNPPYKLALEFVLHALQNTKGVVAMLMRLDFLVSFKRYEALFSKFPEFTVYVFPTPLPWWNRHEKGWRVGGFPVAWYVWNNWNGAEYEKGIRWIPVRYDKNFKFVYPTTWKGAIKTDGKPRLFEVTADSKIEARELLRQKTGILLSPYFFNALFHEVQSKNREKGVQQ